jgi:hypothetical protein
MQSHVAEATDTPLQMRAVTLPDGTHGVACIHGACDDEQLTAMVQDLPDAGHE